jgi:CDP-diacylglycerol--serine O-phosphatidyltransferase
MSGLADPRGTSASSRGDSLRPPSLHPSLADLITIAHGLCGFLAVVLLAGRLNPDAQGDRVTVADLRLVAALVAAGAVLDLLDGPVARRFGSSGLGDRLDGICDTVTFGVAPAVVIAASGSSRSRLAYSCLIAAGAVYLVAMILRLVRSEMTSPEVLKRGFQGLPSAPAAGTALGLVALNASPAVTCLLVAMLALLVVGSFYYPRQRVSLMPLMAGGPVVGLLGIWGVLPVKPAAIAMIIMVVIPAAATATATWRSRRAEAAEVVSPIGGGGNLEF